MPSSLRDSPLFTEPTNTVPREDAKKPEVAGENEEFEAEEDEYDNDESWSDEEDVGEALDWLDAKDVSSGGSLSSFSHSGSRRPNAHGGLLSRSLQPLSNRNQKLYAHISAYPLEEWQGRMDNSVATAIRSCERNMAIGKVWNNDKSDRATVEQAIDPRTRMVLFKMLNRGVFKKINGCISTGKEANVYHATKADGQELAINSGLCVRAYVYKPYVLIFLVIILLGMSSITPLPHFASPASPNTRHSSSEWTNRNGEEEDKAVKVTVWWDIENCPIPTGVDPFQVANHITSALRFNGINGPITITAYGNMLQFNPSTCDALFTTGVALKYVPSCGKNSADRSILADLVYWVAQNPPPAHFFLISGDRDFASILHRLRMSNYNVLLASGSSNGSAALSGAATVIWNWDVLVRGVSFTGKHLNHPPDGLNGSWYGQCQDFDEYGDDDVNENENKLPAIPSPLVSKISEILSSNPNGISINALSMELRKSRVPIDRHYYGYSKLSSLVSSLSNIAVVKQHPEFQYDLMAYSAIVGTPNLDRYIQNTPPNPKQYEAKPASKPSNPQTPKNSEVYFLEMHERITQNHS